jgi:hypothetical protein
MDALARITERVTRAGHPDQPGTPTYLLSLAEFFDGNNYVGSIGCNLAGSPGPAEFYSLFTSMAARPEVRDIRVQITMFDDPEWPFSDTVYIMTSASPREVAGWFPEALHPDETWEGFIANQKYEPYEIPAGYKAIACWWD